MTEARPAVRLVRGLPPSATRPVFRKNVLSFLSGCYSAWDLGYVGGGIGRRAHWSVAYAALRGDWNTIAYSLHNAMLLLRRENPGLGLPEAGPEPDAKQLDLPLEEARPPAASRRR